MIKNKLPDENELPHHAITRLNPARHRVAVVIPVWNQGNTIIEQLAGMQKAALPVDVMLADCASADGSMEASRLSALGVCDLLVTTERGLGTALRMGIAHAVRAGYEFVITIDGNGKDDYLVIPRVIEKLEGGIDFVQASRFLPGASHTNTPAGRWLGIKLIIVPLVNLSSGFRYTDPTNGFKGFSVKLLLDHRFRPFRKVFERFNFQFYINVRVPQLGCRIAEIPAARNYPADGSVPTKIHGLQTHFALFWQLILSAVGWYKPRD